MSSLKKRRKKYYLDKERDWRKDGVLVDDPPDQIEGTCWVYAAVAAVEGNLQVCGIDGVKPSLQELIDCCYMPGGLNGGNCAFALRYIQFIGITTTSEYPTSVPLSKGLCQRCHEKMRPRVKIKNHIIIEDVTVKSLMEAVDKTPVVVSLLAGDKFEKYKKEDNVFMGEESYPLDLSMEGYDARTLQYGRRAPYRTQDTTRHIPDTPGHVSDTCPSIKNNVK